MDDAKFQLCRELNNKIEEQQAAFRFFLNKFKNVAIYKNKKFYF